MFAYIKGTLIATDPNTAVVECGGIGYKLTASSHTIADFATARDGQVCAYTHLCVREDALELIGFSTTEELDMFRLLIGVSGIGPKAAVSVLSLLSVAELAHAVQSGDTKRIAKAPNIGPKTAARIVLELKDKLSAFGALPQEDEEAFATPEAGGNRSEAEQALVALGYSLHEAEQALRGIDTSEPLEVIMTKVLRKMGQRL